jgi:AcrR family transcriptional regulator
MAAHKTKKRSSRNLPRRRRDTGLPEALLAATEDILREHGLDKFTLREAARRAGVSHGAPAFHFGDVSGLLTAFAASGYRGMTALMVKYRAAAPKDPSAQLVAVGSAYIDYAIAHRPQFQLMFRSDSIRLDDAAYMECSKDAFHQLQETMMPFLGPDATDQQRKLKLMLAWSAVHGFATLVLEKRFKGFYVEERNPALSVDGREMLEMLTASFGHKI